MAFSQCQKQKVKEGHGRWEEKHKLGTEAVNNQHLATHGSGKSGEVRGGDSLNGKRELGLHILIVI